MGRAGCNTRRTSVERLRLVVEVLPGEVPEVNRLRAWLKRGLRDYGIRCRSVGPESPPPADDHPGHQTADQSTARS